MQGYAISSSGNLRRAINETHCVMRKDENHDGAYAVVVHVHPDDARALEIKPAQMWTMVPWTPWEGVAEQVIAQRQGTLAFLMNPGAPLYPPSPAVRRGAGGWFRWTRTVDRRLLYQFLARLGITAPDWFVIRDVRFERDSDGVGLVFYPEDLGATTFLTGSPEPQSSATHGDRFQRTTQDRESLTTGPTTEVESH